MAENNKPSKARSAMKIGFVLVAASYVLLLPTFFFLARSCVGSTSRWCQFAGVTYIASWTLFGIGFLLAGPGIVRLVYLWATDLLRRRR